MLYIMYILININLQVVKKQIFVPGDVSLIGVVLLPHWLVRPTESDLQACNVFKRYRR